jgi:hypothetical protein
MRRLAVVPVHVRRGDPTCRKISETAYSNIEQGLIASGYPLASRAQLKAAVEQFGVSISSTIAPDQARRFGEALGVDGIVLPYCERIGRADWRLRVLDPASGGIVVDSTLFGSWPGSVEGVRKWIAAIKDKLG